MPLKTTIIKKTITQKILAFLGWLYIRFVYATSSWDFIGRDHMADMAENDTPFIMCFWHHRLLMLPLSWQWKMPFRMMLSLHNDGQLIGNILSYFNIGIISGSTSKGGDRAARAFIKSLRKNTSVGITPDGPRGPSERASIGIAQLSKLSKAKVVPVSYSTKRHKRLKTWDHFFVALPFTRGVFTSHPPLDPCDFETVEDLQSAIESALNDITRLADEHVGISRV